MKVRDSGMPEEAYWETLFDAGSVVEAFLKTHASPQQRTVAQGAGRNRILELGCGYGTFTVELARRTTGQVDSIDLEPKMVSRTRQRLSDGGLKNASVHKGDFVADDLPSKLSDYDTAILFHIMHVENPVDLLQRVAERIRPGGRFAFLHWRPDQETPRGPDMTTRPTLTDYQRWAATLKLEPPQEIVLRRCPHHFAVECRKPN